MIRPPSQCKTEEDIYDTVKWIAEEARKGVPCCIRFMDGLMDFCDQHLTRRQGFCPIHGWDTCECLLSRP